MLKRDYWDIIGGLLLLAFGIFITVYAASHYDLGTINRMGPGQFPAALGVVVAIFGLLQMIPAFFRSGRKPEIRLWTPLFVLASVVAFAMLIRSFGLIPAVIGVTVISSFAELKVRPANLAGLTAALCLISWLIFHVALGLPVPVARWPF